jgi:hypothetical protein
MAVPTVKLPSGQTVKLGRIIPKTRPNVLRLAPFLKRTGKPLPAEVDYSSKAAAALSQVYGNDQWGDCVIASRFHATGVKSAEDTGKPAVGNTNEAVTQYHTICGRGDNGCVMTDVYDWQKAKGLTVGGKLFKVDGYVAVNSQNADEVKTAIKLLGGLSVGFTVPSEWINETRPGVVWDVPRRWDSVGGHEVQAVGYNTTGVVVATWGYLATITWRALADARGGWECYAALEPAWYNDDQLAPSGFDVKGLQAALSAFDAGQLPPWEPPAPVPPTPVPPGPTPTPPNVTGNVTLTGYADVLGAHIPIALAGHVTPPTENVTMPELPPFVRRSIDWATIIALLAQYGPVIAQIIIDIINGHKAGASWMHAAKDSWHKHTSGTPATPIGDSPVSP